MCVGRCSEAKDKRSNSKVVIKMVACDSINSGNNALQVGRPAIPCPDPLDPGHQRPPSTLS